ncbi:GTP pyrophosphokinase [Barnesiella viscericola DSM 18177]|uniref:GTP pyrophosphokinase n=1 Tax=Barnesiella viscericola DSM 18177 TaxID=880074 RepID=W0ENH1_9BACT|nr:RelA/SpoT family protein [Barnesiella viscericola]AHF12375.1 GTP pyrophosphokinase [Barnesiella viscericola DSM 18177]
MEPSDQAYTNEEQLIEDKFQELLNGYLNSNHRKKVEIIERAFKFAKEAHKGIRRRSGEPYILHPIAVARIVSQEIGLGSTSICAALLHDVVEDTEYTVEDIENHFGKKIASIVDGLTKISGGIFGDQASAQAENFRRLLLTMSEDIRVILIKMADRLHNMRTLGSMLPSKQYKIAGETLYIYAPLAHRLGLFAIKTELEDLAFKYEHPDAYNQIKQKIAETEESRQQIYNNFAKPIVAKLKELGFDFEMKARVKSIYSIWNKMEAKHIPFEEVYDLYAVRIIFKCPNEADEKKECWTIYSVITDIYKLHPERTRDWVSRPKANGYKALHLTVMGPDGNWIEVQIRSEKMDEIAERGFAAHWKYKVGNSDEESELDIWLKTIKDILEHPEPNAIDFLDTIKLNLFSTEIFVFTPKGELITLPKDATALDLAFTLHSDLGFHCIAAKVNHRLVPLSQKLQSGDQVEILTSKSQTPKEEWLNLVTTAKARSRLMTALRKDRRKIIAKGETQFKEYLANNHLDYSNELVTKIVSALGLQNREDLFFKIGNEEITPNENIKKIIKGKSVNPFMRYLKLSFGNNSKNEPAKTQQPQHPTIDRKQTYILRDVNGVKNYKVADCCCPIPGDDVLGYVEDDETVVVHKRECPVAMRLKSSFGPRLVSTQWEASKSLSFPAKIEIQGIDRMGILNEITRVISNELMLDMRGLTIQANEGVFDGTVNIMVHDTQVVESLCNKLRKIKGVQKAARCKE